MSSCSKRKLAQTIKALKHDRSTYVNIVTLAKQLETESDDVLRLLESLEREGYVIERHPNLGFRLQEVPDIILPHEVYSEMSSDLWTEGPLSLNYYPKLPSTNSRAKTLASQGAADGTFVLTDEQTQGKGRQGRSWISRPNKDLTFSLVLRPLIEAQRIPFLTIFAAASVAAALREEYGLSVGLKWPNDVVIEGRKLGGILTEAQGLEGNVHFAVVGIGLNVNSLPEEFPHDVADRCTSLAAAMGRSLHRADVLGKIIERLRKHYRNLQRGSSAKIIETWKSLSDTIGKYVQVSDSTSGYAEDIDEEGSLVLRLENGMRKRVWVGDLTQLF